jgi:hypothetical protein
MIINVALDSMFHEAECGVKSRAPVAFLTNVRLGMNRLIVIL